MSENRHGQETAGILTVNESADAVQMYSVSKRVGMARNLGLRKLHVNKMQYIQR